MNFEQQEELIHTIEELKDYLAESNALVNCTLQDMDLTQANVNWEVVTLDNVNFLGCEMKVEDELTLRKKGGHIYIKYNDTPYNPYRRDLYTWQELMEGYSPEADHSTDYKDLQTLFLPAGSSRIFTKR